MPEMTVIHIVINNKNHGHYGGVKYRGLLSGQLMFFGGAVIIPQGDDDFLWPLEEKS